MNDWEELELLWSLVVMELEKKEARSLSRLAVVKDLESLREEQGYIRALRELKILPSSRKQQA